MTPPKDEDITKSSSTQAIPNLFETLRAAKASRGSSRTSGSAGSRSINIQSSQAKTSARPDFIVQQTDDDAAGSRLSAVELGYLDDPFATEFWTPPNSGHGSEKDSGHVPRVRRMPIINRGTYVRTMAIDALVSSFLVTHDSVATVQIISLGAGTDTRFFRFICRNPDLRQRLLYHEIDFPITTRKKVEVIKRTPALIALLAPRAAETMYSKKSPDLGDDEGSEDTVTDLVEKEAMSDKPSVLTDSQAHAPDFSLRHFTIAAGDMELHSDNYHIHALDLRELGASGSTSSSLPSLHAHIDPTAPTLILSEMCLTYLPAELSTSVLRYVTQTLLSNSSASSSPSTAATISIPPSVEVVLYEPFHPHDAFGRTMLENLGARGIDLPGLVAFPTLGDHGRRLVGGSSKAPRDTSAGIDSGCGFTGWEGWTVLQWWRDHVPHTEKERLRTLELVDEEEEWELLAGHYGIIQGWRGIQPKAVTQS